MTDLMQRLRAADPLAGKLPEALAGQPRPPRAGAQVRRRRYAPLLVAGAVAMTTLLAVVFGGEGREGGIAAAAYAAIAPGNDVVHLITVSTERGAGSARTRGELWYSRERLHAVYSTNASRQGRPAHIRETAISPTSWQSYDSRRDTLLVIDAPQPPLLRDRAVPHGLDEVEDFKRFYEAGRMVEDGREILNGQEVLRLVLRNAPDRLTYLVKPIGGEPVATRRTHAINGTTTTKIVHILRYERLPLNDAARNALRMSDHPRAHVARPTSAAAG